VTIPGHEPLMGNRSQFVIGEHDCLVEWSLRSPSQLSESIHGHCRNSPEVSVRPSERTSLPDRRCNIRRRPPRR
jgi:hypothetical protein